MLIKNSINGKIIKYRIESATVFADSLTKFISFVKYWKVRNISSSTIAK